MIPQRAVKRLRDAANASSEIADFIDGVTLDDYLHDRSRRLIIERLLEIVGEAMSQAVQEDSGLLTLVPEARMVIGMRNRIIHGYDDIKDEIVWDAATTGVAALREHLDSLLKREGWG